MSTEAAAGKNPISHVGKIYTLLTHRIAEEIYTKISGVEEVYVWLGSQIGMPIDRPLIASAHVNLKAGVALADIESDVQRIFNNALDKIDDFTARLSKGELPVW
jgi:S-adenosylmethionine synthetase